MFVKYSNTFFVVLYLHSNVFHVCLYP